MKVAARRGGIKERVSLAYGHRAPGGEMRIVMADGLGEHSEDVLGDLLEAIEQAEHRHEVTANLLRIAARRQCEGACGRAAALRRLAHRILDAPVPPMPWDAEPELDALRRQVVA